MLRTLLRLSIVLVAVGLVTMLRSSQPTLAVVHLAEIHELMAGFDGDPDVQFVEINMRLGGQNITSGSKLATFDSAGVFIDADPGTLGNQPLLSIVGNVPNSGAEIRWLMATSEFETASGLDADFLFPASPGLPASVGMVCVFESGRDFTNPGQSIDCVAYGGASFTGANPNSSPSEAATTGPGDDIKSLTRIEPATLGGTVPWARSDDANDFTLLCPSPENNAFERVLLGDDDDSDGLPNCHEAELGSDDQVPDTDGDGCLDGKEANTLDPDGTGPQGAQLKGGLRSPTNPYDYYDVVGAGGGPKDQIIDLPNDILGVILHFSPFGAAPYDVTYDRGPSTGPHPWNMTAPDGVIDLPNDILGVILQFQHNCA